MDMLFDQVLNSPSKNVSLVPNKSSNANKYGLIFQDDDSDTESFQSDESEYSPPNKYRENLSDAFEENHSSLLVQESSPSSMITDRFEEDGENGSIDCIDGDEAISENNEKAISVNSVKSDFKLKRRRIKKGKQLSSTLAEQEVSLNNLEKPKSLPKKQNKIKQVKGKTKPVNPKSKRIKKTSTERAVNVTKGNSEAKKHKKLKKENVSMPTASQTKRKYSETIESDPNDRPLKKHKRSKTHQPSAEIQRNQKTKSKNVATLDDFEGQVKSSDAPDSQKHKLLTKKQNEPEEKSSSGKAATPTFDTEPIQAEAKSHKRKTVDRCSPVSALKPVVKKCAKQIIDPKIAKLAGKAPKTRTRSASNTAMLSISQK